MIAAVQVRRSALWMVGAILAFSLTAIAGKEATSVQEPALSVSQLVFYRNVIGLMCVLLLCFISTRRSSVVTFKTLFHTTSMKLHVMRNVSHFSGQWCWFYGLALLPLAHVFAIEFTVPIWTAVFALVFLREKLTGRKLLALVIGFSAVLIILRPGASTVELASYVVLFGAVAYALSHTLTKQISKHDSALNILLYMHLIQLPLALVLLLFDFAWPQGIVWLYVALTAIAAMSAHYCLAKALSYSEAMVVMPMDFLRLPLIALLGYFLYQEAIDAWLVVGVLMMLVGNVLTLKEASKSAS